MRIDYEDKGAVATMTITSSVFEFRRHNHAVDTALFLAPGTIIASRSGFLLMKTVISGPVNKILRAYKIAQKDVQK
ncbi:hypothetical protein TUM17576_41840 [Enterobacter hormaechei]|nr:hypothetical protein [Enterobacter hormaechei]GJL37364.1 hypothetical protein TUM17576_41840 [Enterobacter hormaechei]